MDQARRLSNAVIGVFAFSSLLFYVANTLAELGHTTFDDAYMVTRYAKHWLAGQGFSWNPTEGPSYGITSPAYLIVITAVLGLTGCSDAMALTATSFVAGLLAAVALVALGFLVQPGERSRRTWIPLLALPAVLLLPPFPFHSLTGMETTLAMLVNTLLACAIVLAVRNRSTASLITCLLCSCLSFATRPDNGIYALLLPPLCLISDQRSRWRQAVVFSALFVLALGAGLIINKSLFGDFLPLPFYAKSSGFYEGYAGATKWNATTGLTLFGISALPCLLVVVATVSRTAMSRLLPAVFTVAATFAYFATVTQIMGQQARYYYPSLPFVFLAAFHTLFTRDRASKGDRTDGALGLRMLAGLLLMVPALSFSFQQLAAHLWERYALGLPQAASDNRTDGNGSLPEISRWKGITAMGNLLGRLPRETLLAASEYGYIGSLLPDLAIVDFVGLHDRAAARTQNPAAYVLSRKPDLIWMPHSDYTHLVDQLLRAPDFQGDYEYYPEAYLYGIALRKSSPLYGRIKGEVERQFALLYRGSRLADFERPHPP